MLARAFSTRARAGLCVTAAIASAIALAAPAHASFGFERMEVDVREEGGAPATQAGSHPYTLTTTLLLNRKPLEPEQRGGGLGNSFPLGEEIAEGDVKDLEATLPAGVVVNLQGVERCSEEELAQEKCPLSAQVGTLATDSPFGTVAAQRETPVFNVVPSSPNVPGELGFAVAGVGIISHVIGGVHAGGDYGISGKVPGIPQIANLDGTTLTLWGDP